MKAAIHKAVLAVAVLLPAVAPVPASADPIVLERTSRWNVHYDDDACHLTAGFGEGERGVTMRLTSYGWQDSFRAMFVGSPLSTRTNFTPVRVGFGDQPEMVERTGTFAGSGDTSMLLVSGLRLDNYDSYEHFDDPDAEAPEITPEQQAAVTSVTVKRRGFRDLRLNTGPMDRTMAAMRTCVRTLITSWGYDPDVYETLQRGARASDDAGRWLNWRDFPAIAMVRRQQGLVVFRLDVDAAGAVTGCKVLDQSDPDLFSQVTCEQLRKRAKLDPAIDADGNPVASFYVNQVLWRL